MATLTRRQGCINMFSVILMCLVLSRKIRNTIRWSNTYCYQTMLLMTKLFDLSFELNLDEELGSFASIACTIINVRITHSWETWPLWNKEKLLLSKIVQENASQKNERYWTAGQNTAQCYTITRPMEIHQYWTVPRQTQKMTTQSFAEKWKPQYNYWRKGNQLESTTSHQKWSKQVQRM